MRSISLFVLSAALLFQDVASAEAPPESAVPLERMQALSMLAGKWKMTVSITPDEGKTWQATPPQLVDVHFSHKGMLLEEVPESLDSPGFHMHSLISFDQYRKTYRKAATDDVWGVMDMYEGNVEGDRLVLTNLKSKTYFPITENAWRGFRLTIELKPGQRIIWIDKTDDDGKSWQPAFKAHYVSL